MYVALLLGLLAIAGRVIARGVQLGRLRRILAGAGLAVLTLLFFAFLSFWGEVLWFRAIGYERRFWVQIAAQIGFGLSAAAASAAVIYLLTLRVSRRSKLVRIWPETVAAVAGLVWGASNWDVVLRFLNRFETGAEDPILGKDFGFYLFSLPFYDALYVLLLWIACIAVLAAFVGIFVTATSWLDLLSGSGMQAEARRFWFAGSRRREERGSLSAALATLALVLASGRLLASYHLLYSEFGVVVGAGWTDVHVRLPAYYGLAVLLLLAAVAQAVPALRRSMAHTVPRRLRKGLADDLVGRGVIGAVVAVLAVAALGLLPALVQWLVVEPNEISLERPYIEHNIELTRQAFGLDRAEEREFPAAELTPATLAANRDVISEVRLWDSRALVDVYKQFQEIRLYYEFIDVDFDRYRIGDRYRQVMVSARELAFDNLPEQSQTFVNRRFKYTHGHGLTMAPVSDFTADGLPNLLVRDIPAQAAAPELEVTTPAIYYGELTDSHVYVNTLEEEFDYPRGDENVYVRYQGRGGVRLKNLFRKFLFGWKLDGTRFLMSSYPHEDSRVLFHRDVRDRVGRLAPFLELDDDPYIVLVGGKLYWILDAYTVSEYYPYSTPFSSREEIEVRRNGGRGTLRQTITPHLEGQNYVRNSVKAVVDAYDGTVTFYVFDDDDPMIAVWQRVFPRLFAPSSAMPPELRAHVRYPIDLLLVQGLVYARYHMRDPTVFYNQEDLWVRATEKYGSDLQPVEPYYVMWRPPGGEEAEFVLILPFTPKNRQVLIGWIAAMCDGPNYGRFLTYKFSKERRVLGPQQVETKIDQDRFLSGQLTLWDQRGSKVVRGNVLAIPLDGSLLYVEPIYLRAETAAYPELRLVVVMHGDRLSYGETFEQALRGLFEPEARTLPAVAPTPGTELTTDEHLRQAAEALQSFRRLQGEGRYEEAGRELERLQRLLER